MKYSAISIPASYGHLDSPTPGTVAGIILGSVLGFIFLLYLIYLALSSGRRFSSETETSTPSSTEISAAPRRRRREDIVEVEEGSGSYRGGRRNTDRILDESVLSRSDEGDTVEVLEEESDSMPPRRQSRRSGYRRDQYEDSEWSSRV
ncbi:hypothetical protein EYZ11_000029 [Aspergillus tanneri]|uniref:Uncharacterized protein n=1 Tax=Aspergillus tanneri TaxID=1220188 RepID=A0A4S3JY27_9EURO|nr:uncharacterized protein ATNIH1004_000600 [Aspergillus tanneri]KAA8651704.1 hypothetical protein ATNIH1004_000600 [Aspergillus tanneri]THD00465.1 hypothetical protein EYZ11_000029 [Aspergillus tanneri]